MASDTIPAIGATEEADCDLLLKGNARRIFSEPDAAKRLAALQEIWADDGTLVERDAVATGHAAISTGVGALLAQLPPGTNFVPQGDAVGHHGLARLRWQASDADGAPLPVTGTDIAFVQDGKIVRLYVVLDAKA